MLFGAKRITVTFLRLDNAPREAAMRNTVWH